MQVKIAGFLLVQIILLATEKLWIFIPAYHIILVKASTELIIGSKMPEAIEMNFDIFFQAVSNEEE